MKTLGHLWAIAFDHVDRAEQVRAEVHRIAQGYYQRNILVEAMAVLAREPDGSFRLNREPFPVVRNIAACSVVGFLAGLVMLQPLTGAAIGAAIGSAGSVVGASISSIGIDDDFIRDVQAHLKPGTSALFLLDADADLHVVLPQLRGLGGTVLKTNVDAERARCVQEALAAPPAAAPSGETKP
jgi:uncharacterized membrane protein